jgi:hypothetical protein
LAFEKVKGEEKKNPLNQRLSIDSFFPLHQIKVLSYPSTASLIGIPKQKNRA